MTKSRKTPELVHVWMAMDKETRRVLVQNREFQDGDFPPGLRGQWWPKREIDVPEAEFVGLLDATITDVPSDIVHRKWWDDARGTEPPWPYLPGEEP